MAQEGMAVNCTLTFQYKLLTLIKFGQVGMLTTATPLSRTRYIACLVGRTLIWLSEISVVE
jgi:hypothetical protein